MKFMSYTLAAVAGLCFVSGLLILHDEGDKHHGATRNIGRIIGGNFGY